MKVGVCIKQVPDTEARLRPAADGRWIDEEEMQFRINEGDEYALEEAISIAEASGGEAVVICLGPPRAREALRKALALGAARAIHLSDEAFQGGDSQATARQQGKYLPAVVLVQVGDIYFVQDGHHRISVARALGQSEIEARVTIWQVSGPLPWETPAQAPSRGLTERLLGIGGASRSGAFKKRHAGEKHGLQGLSSSASGLVTGG